MNDRLRGGQWCPRTTRITASTLLQGVENEGSNPNPRVSQPLQGPLASFSMVDFPRRQELEFSDLHHLAALFPVGPTPWAIAPGMAPAPKREMGRISRISTKGEKCRAIDWRQLRKPAGRADEPRLELVGSRVSNTAASNKGSQPLCCKANASLQSLSCFDVLHSRRDGCARGRS